MVIFWNNTIIFLTGGCSDINGTVPHSLKFYHKKLVCSRMLSQNETLLNLSIFERNMSPFVKKNRECNLTMC